MLPYNVKLNMEILTRELIVRVVSGSFIFSNYFMPSKVNWKSFSAIKVLSLNHFDLKVMLYYISGFHKLIEEIRCLFDLKMIRVHLFGPNWLSLKWNFFGASHDHFYLLREVGVCLVQIYHGREIRFYSFILLFYFSQIIFLIYSKNI